jgi:hypothetical protein
MQGVTRGGVAIESRPMMNPRGVDASAAVHRESSAPACSASCAWVVGFHFCQLLGVE